MKHMNPIADLNFPKKEKSLILKKEYLGSGWEFSSTKNSQPSLALETNLAKILACTPGLVSWKNRDSLFLGCNRKFTALAGISSPEQIAGKYDNEMPWGKGDYADIFRKEDKEVLEGTISFTLGKYSFCDKKRIILTQKIPLCDKNSRAIGIINFIHEFQNNLTDIVNELMQFDIEATPALLTYIKNLLGGDHGVHFSLREKECLYYLLRGLSGKEIARHLNLSFRTIEAYVAAIKTKLSCHKTSQVIIKAIELGYSNYTIPAR